MSQRRSYVTTTAKTIIYTSNTYHFSITPEMSQKPGQCIQEPLGKDRYSCADREKDYVHIPL